MSNKTHGQNSPYMRGPGGMPGGAPPSPPPQAKTMYLIAKGKEGPETTDDYLDERADGGPEAFQLIQMMGPGGQVGTKFVRGKTIWDSFAETALSAIVKATTRIEKAASARDGDPLPDTLSAGDAKQVAAMAAAFADALLEEKKRRDPQVMKVAAGHELIQP